MTNNTLVGQDLRALRNARKMTLGDLADKLDKSEGWISQVERDISVPTLDDLRQTARAFNVPLSICFGTSEVPENERGVVVRVANWVTTSPVWLRPSFRLI